MIIPRKSRKCVRLIQPANNNHFCLEFELECMDSSSSSSSSSSSESDCYSEKSALLLTAAATSTTNTTNTTTCLISKKKEYSVKRSVQIDTRLNQCYEIDICQTLEEVRARWFSASELRRFRSSVCKRLLGQQQRHRDHSYESSLSSEEDATTTAAAEFSFRNALKEMYIEQKHAARNNNSNQQQQPLTWCEHHYLKIVRQHPEFLGMERFVLDGFTTRDDKAQRRRQLLSLIRDAYKTAAAYNNNGSSCSRCGGGGGGNISSHSMAEFIRHACETVNQQSCAMAQRIAHIHATHLLTFQEEPRKPNNNTMVLAVRQDYGLWSVVVDNLSKPVDQEWCA